MIERLRAAGRVHVSAVYDVDDASGGAQRRSYDVEPDLAARGDDRRRRRRRGARPDEHERARPARAAALEAGKHVLVEKPMATSLEEAAELLELCADGAGPARLRAAHRCSARPSAPSTRAVRAGEIGDLLTARARYGWAGPMVERVVLRAGRRLAVRPRRLQRHEPVRPLRPGAAGDGDGRHGDPRADGERPPDPGRRRRQRARAARLRRCALRRRHDRVHDAAIPVARDRGLRQRGHDPAPRRRLGAGRVGALAERGGRMARVPRVGSPLALDRRAATPRRLRRDRAGPRSRARARLPRARDHARRPGRRPRRRRARDRERLPRSRLRRSSGSELDADRLAHDRRSHDGL